MTLFTCAPLSARLTPQSCKANKARGVWACEKCSGLAEAFKIIEEDVMGSRCNIKGCEKWSVIGGYCTTHADPVALAGKNARYRIKRTSSIAPEGEAVNPEVYPEQKEHIISGEEIHVINLLQFVREKLQADLDAEMLTVDRHLGLLTNPAEKLKYVFDRVYS